MNKEDIYIDNITSSFNLNDKNLISRFVKESKSEDVLKDIMKSQNREKIFQAMKGISDYQKSNKNIKKLFDEIMLRLNKLVRMISNPVFNKEIVIEEKKEKDESSYIYSQMTSLLDETVVGKTYEELMERKKILEQLDYSVHKVRYPSSFYYCDSRWDKLLRVIEIRYENEIKNRENKKLKLWYESSFVSIYDGYDFLIEHLENREDLKLEKILNQIKNKKIIFNKNTLLLIKNNLIGEEEREVNMIILKNENELYLDDFRHIIAELAASEF